MKKLKVGVLGATGFVGQRFVTILENHPNFEVVVLAASCASANKKYYDVVKDRWKIKEEIPEYSKNMIVLDVMNVDEISELVDLIFCALDMPKEELKKLEELYAKHEVYVISNNSANRMVEDVPVVIPEINQDHFKVIEAQRKRLGTKKGFIVCKPNCSIQCYVPLLNALWKFEPYMVAVSTYQAVSGAGKTLESWSEMNDNLIPFIKGEEEKSEVEPLKIWGSVCNNKIKLNDDIKITSQCIRVPVSDGHLATVFVKFRKKPAKEEIIECWNNSNSISGLYSSPKKFITYFSEDDRPQPKLDRNLDGGMTISVGRLREDAIFDYRFVGFAHNTLRGAAKGALLMAELLYSLGYFE